MGGTVGHGEEGRAPSPDDLDRSYTSAPKWWTDDVSAALADDELAFARRRAHTARRLPKQRGAEATRPGVLESGGERLVVRYSHNWAFDQIGLPNGTNSCHICIPSGDKNTGHTW